MAENSFKSPPPTGNPPNGDGQKAANGNVTYRLLELLHDDHQPENMVAASHDHEEEIHVDERWLISYADKMTILCGFFIMLFAISTLDPVKLQQVQDSAQKSFGKPQAVVKPIVSLEEIQKIQEQQRIQAEQIDKLEEEKKELEKTLTTASNVKERNKILSERLQKVLVEKSELTTKVQVLEKRVRTLAMQIPSTKDPKPEDLQKEIERLKQVVTNSKQTISKLEKELDNAKSNFNSTGFVAFVMSWDTRDHDVDLIVEDPKKRSFDFKRREYKSHPGLLVLDTRQGPGVEIWQADKILPGTYTFTYLFYKAYGNQKPVTLTGTLFTSKGRLSMPSITLDSEKKKTIKLRVNITEEGKATLLP